MALLLALALCLPQGPADAALVSGALQGGKLSLAALGLGNGGTLGTAKGMLEAARLEPGQTLTPAAILVRAQEEGVKLDFPSGAELLLSPSARIHLRSGESTLACFSGIELWLADGSRVRAIPAPGGNLPYERVEVLAPRASVVLWRARGSPAEPGDTMRTRGQVLLVLGDGRMLYHAVPFGPLVLLQRVLCPKDQEAAFPAAKVLLLGDVLAASLRALPAHAPDRSVQFPAVREAALALAELAPRLFTDGVVERPARARGALVLPLPEDFHLLVEVHDRAPVTIGLYRADVPVPAVEWTIDVRTEVHFVRPGGGAEGGPRYFLRGIDVGELVRGVLPVPVTERDLMWARDALRRLGAGAPSSELQVTRERAR